MTFALILEQKKKWRHLGRLKSTVNVKYTKRFAKTIVVQYIQQKSSNNDPYVLLQN